MELGVQQLIQPFTTATDSWVVEFDFEGLQFLKEGCHVECVLYAV